MLIRIAAARLASGLSIACTAALVTATGMTRRAPTALASGSAARGGSDAAQPLPAGCPRGMVRVDGMYERAFCIDRFEASLVKVGPDGKETPHSPFETTGGAPVRAIVRAGVVPQAYVSRHEADVACTRSHKRLCTEAEWVLACVGTAGSPFPYGPVHVEGYCNDAGEPPLPRLSEPLHEDSWDRLNDPRLNQLPHTVSKTGSHRRCKSSFGAFDMVGNLHEWVADADGRFLGGYYLDTTRNGEGCLYKTVAHGGAYHDYSTGFRCCAELVGSP